MKITLDKNLALKINNVSKKFGLTLKQSMKYGLLDNAQRLLRKVPRTEDLRLGEFWALRNVSLELKKGDALGVMGVNGSGKTTLLRLMNGLYAPDVGHIAIKGRVGAMIAAGAGFAPNLTGRENININGALLGMSSSEINSVMEDIIKFAELNDFIDMPVKNYSSGMTIRLGFAISVFSNPDVLLMDEILAVGDMNFQKKCFDRILELKTKGTSIILVSHNVGSIWAVCDRAIFIDKGVIRIDGAVEDVIRAYDDQNARNAVIPQSKLNGDFLPAEYGHPYGGTGEIKNVKVSLNSDDDHNSKSEFQLGQSFNIATEFSVLKAQNDLLLRFTIDAAHYRFIATIDSFEQGLELKRVEPGKYRLFVKVINPNFRPGSYKVNFSASVKQSGIHLFYWLGAANFLIKQPSLKFLYSEPNAVMHLDGEFRLELIS